MNADGVESVAEVETGEPAISGLGDVLDVLQGFHLHRTRLTKRVDKLQVCHDPVRLEGVWLALVTRVML